MSTSDTRHVIVHAANAPGDAERALETARGIAESMAGTRVTVIVNGPALEGMPEIVVDVPGTVEVQACAVGLQRRGIDASTLPSAVGTTPSAAVAIVEAQFAGAAYLRL